MNATRTNADRIADLCRMAREYHRTGDTVRRNQTEETIRELSPTRAYAAKIIAELYAESAN